MLSVDAPSYNLDLSTQNPSPLTFMVTTATRDNFPDHMKYFSQPAMKPPRSFLLTPPRPSKDSEQARKRQIFLTKVRQASNERTWQSRSDQILRADYEARRKRWEEDKARSAPDMPTVPEDEDIEIKLRSPGGGIGEMETVEAFQHQEDQELDALVSLLEESDPATGNNDLAEFGNDDDDFPWICTEVIDAADAKVMGNPPDSLLVPSDDMDTSVG